MKHILTRAINITLCLAYANGEAVPRDPAQVADFYRNAAEQGNAKAQSNLGSRYLAGAGVAKDTPDGFKWLRKAAGQGTARSRQMVRRKRCSPPLPPASRSIRRAGM
ncbi:MAG: tetratricopeptide repeat protein [Chthoniobacteraceae bacterium]